MVTKDDKEKVTQITIRNVSSKLHNRIKQEAENNRRSANSELLIILERYFLELDAISTIFQTEGEKVEKIMDELVKQILNMASSGVWRQEIFLGIESVSQIPYKVINEAIKEAREKGMYSIADMRDVQKGTYYQYDEVENG